MGAFALALFTSVALAQDVAPELIDARLRLGASDLDRDKMIEVVQAMTAFVPRARSAPDRREARYLRSVLAADLLAAAALGRDGELNARVAQAFGVPETAVAPTVRAELRSLRVGAYREGAEQALFGLESATGVPVTVPVPAAGARADLAYAAQVVAAASTPDPVSAAAELASDPCESECDGVFRRIPTASGRRAAHALVRAHAALVRASAEADRGDSFARAAHDAIEAAQEHLGRVELDVAALPDGIEGWARGQAGREGHDVRLGFLIVATARGPKYGRFAGVHLDERGELALTGGSPLLPETAPLPGVSVGASVPHIRGAITSLAGEDSLPIAVAAEEGAPVDLLTRVVLALRLAEITPVFIGPAGEHGWTLALVRPTNDPAPFPAGVAEALRVTRMGYLLRTGESQQTMPLLRSARGFSFDVASLEGREAPETSAVSYVRGIDATIVVESALRMVTRGGEPIELVVAN